MVYLVSPKSINILEKTTDWEPCKVGSLESQLKNATQEETFSTSMLDRLIVLGEQNIPKLQSVQCANAAQKQKSNNDFQADSSRGEKAVPDELSGELPLNFLNVVTSY